MNTTEKNSANLSTVTIAKPDLRNITVEFGAVLAEARAIKVVDKATHARAQELMRELARGAKIITKGNRETGGSFEGIDENIAAANKVHKFLTQARKVALGPFEDTVGYLNYQLDGYEREERLKAEEQARILAEEARKQEEERLIQDAIQAEASGNQAEAEQILEESVTTPTVIVQPELAKVEGVSAREQWEAEVYDVSALLRYVASNPEWSALVEPAMPQLNALARAQKGALKIPGVRAVSRTVRSSRT